MKRSLLTFVLFAALGLPGLASAAPDPAPSSSNLDAIRRQQVELYLQAAENAQTLEEKQAYLNKAAQIQQQAKLEEEKSTGAARQLDMVTRQMDRQDKLADAQAKQMEDMYSRPTFWDNVGNKMIDIMGNALAAMLQKWIAGGGKDKELEDQIKQLQNERDQLLNGKNDPSATDTSQPGLGRVITDPNGNYGYDRDGDGYVDIPLNNDGSTGNLNPTNNDGYAAPGAAGGLSGGVNNPYEDNSSNNNNSNSNPGLGSFAGGGVSPGSAFNGGMGPGGSSGVGGVNGPGGAAGDKDKDGKDKDGKAADPLGAANGKPSTSAGSLATTSKDLNGDGKIDEEEAALETVMGRPVILPKLEFEDLAGDKKTENAGWKDEWEDDGWDDSRDNGDKAKKKGKKVRGNKDGSSADDWSDDDDWGDEWGDDKKAGKKKKDAKSDTTSAEEKQAAELVDQIIRVETQLAEWRKVEKKAKAEGKDVYGYTEAGAEKKDPLKDVRDSSGKIDLAKVDVWLIERETWRDGKEPIRYKLKVDEDVKDFDPIHGGVMIIRGKVETLKVDKRVLDEIKGKVKEIEVAQVVLSAEKPPESMGGSLDDSDDVGGLDEGKDTDKGSKGSDDMGSDDEGW